MTPPTADWTKFGTNMQVKMLYYTIFITRSTQITVTDVPMEVTVNQKLPRAVLSLQYSNEGIDNFPLDLNSTIQNDGVSTKNIPRCFI